MTTLTEHEIDADAERRAFHLTRPIVDCGPDDEFFEQASRWARTTWTTRKGEVLEVRDMSDEHATNAWRWARDCWLAQDNAWARDHDLDPVDYTERIMRLTPLGQALSERLWPRAKWEKIGGAPTADLDPVRERDIRAHLRNASTEARPTWWQQRYASDVAVLLAALDTARAR